MDAAIQLEDQAQRRAVEVDEESGDDVLAAEFQAEDPSSSQQLPGGGFGRRGLSAKAPGQRQLAGVDGGTLNHLRRPRRRCCLGTGSAGVCTVHVGSSTRPCSELRGRLEEGGHDRARGDDVTKNEPRRRRFRPADASGANAAWYRLSLLTYNVLLGDEVAGVAALDGDRAPKRMRFSLFSIAGRIVSHAGKLVLRIGREAEALASLIAARIKIAQVGLARMAAASRTTGTLARTREQEDGEGVVVCPRADSPPPPSSREGEGGRGGEGLREKDDALGLVWLRPPSPPSANTCRRSHGRSLPRFQG